MNARVERGLAEMKGLPDRLIWNDLVFRLQHFRNDSWDLGESCNSFFKRKPLIDQYLEYWTRRPEFSARHILEIGMFDGGSIAFWFEFFRPERHVGVDFCTRADSDYFRR